jgi:TonB family protein
MHRSSLRLLAATACLVAAPVVAAEPEVPVANPAEATRAIWQAVAAVGKAPHGTLYANVQIDSDGRATIGDLFGTLQRHEPALAIVRAAMPALVFARPKEWNATQPWVVFWMFQNQGCRERAFDAPPAVTVVRVCLDVNAPARTPDAPSVRFESSRPYAPADQVLNRNIDCPYPKESRRRREIGTAAVLIRVDAKGAGHPIRLVESSQHAELDDASMACSRKLRYVPPADGAPVVLRWTWALEP